MQYQAYSTPITAILYTGSNLDEIHAFLENSSIILTTKNETLYLQQASESFPLKTHHYLIRITPEQYETISQTSFECLFRTAHPIQPNSHLIDCESLVTKLKVLAEEENLSINLEIEYSEDINVYFIHHNNNNPEFRESRFYQQTATLMDQMFFSKGNCNICFSYDYDFDQRTKRKKETLSF